MEIKEVLFNQLTLFKFYKFYKFYMFPSKFYYKF